MAQSLQCKRIVSSWSDSPETSFSALQHAKILKTFAHIQQILTDISVIQKCYIIRQALIEHILKKWHLLINIPILNTLHSLLADTQQQDIQHITHCFHVRPVVKKPELVPLATSLAACTVDRDSYSLPRPNHHWMCIRHKPTLRLGMMQKHINSCVLI
jgi:hypothetical protein